MDLWSIIFPKCTWHFYFFHSLDLVFEFNDPLCAKTSHGHGPCSAVGFFFFWLVLFHAPMSTIVFFLHTCSPSALLALSCPYSLLSLSVSSLVASSDSLHLYPSTYITFLPQMKSSLGSVLSQAICLFLFVHLGCPKAVGCLKASVNTIILMPTPTFGSKQTFPDTHMLL